MNSKIDRRITEILNKAEDRVPVSREEAMTLMGVQLHTRACYAIMEAANRLSRAQFGNKGEKPLPHRAECRAVSDGLPFLQPYAQGRNFQREDRISLDQVVAWAKQAEQHGADGLNLMTTGTYPFARLLEVGRLLKTETAVPLVANTRDINHREGEALLEAGFVGAYHAVRLGEGRDTPFDREKRIRTIQVFRDVGLLWMNCVEPVGPEHADDEIVDLMLLARDFGAVYSGVMRRINFPGSPMERFGMISELEMARLVAISRLVMGDVAQGPLHP